LISRAPTFGAFSWGERMAILSVAQQLEVIERGVVHLQPLEDLKKKLESGRQLTIKLGCDPSRPDLHLGHAVVLRKMRQFQDLGHKVILIIGDFTGMIGDPSGKSKTRPPLSLAQTRENGKSYHEQATLILDNNPAKLEIVYNSAWLEPMGFEEVIRLASKVTVAQIMTREDFSNRFAAGTPISLHELLYPLVQAQDSVAIKADVELGGTDQLFNLMVGRDIQRESNLEPQVVLTMPLLVGLDGVEKMSKSLDNYIGIAEPADVMFSKLMKVPDTALRDYLTLCTNLEVETTLGLGMVGAHRALARAVIAEFHGEGAVPAAEERYDSVAKGGIPEQMKEVLVSNEYFVDGKIGIIKLAQLAGFATSGGEAKRMIHNKGYKLGGELITDERLQLELTEPVVLQKGKNDFVRLTRG
jgi:tyrosyl-tRNA synthetase